MFVFGDFVEKFRIEGARMGKVAYCRLLAFLRVRSCRALPSFHPLHKRATSLRFMVVVLKRKEACIPDFIGYSDFKVHIPRSSNPSPCL